MLKGVNFQRLFSWLFFSAKGTNERPGRWKKALENDKFLYLDYCDIIAVHTFAFCTKWKNQYRVKKINYIEQAKKDAHWICRASIRVLSPALYQGSAKCQCCQRTVLQYIVVAHMVPFLKVHFQTVFTTSMITFYYFTRLTLGTAVEFC